MGSSIEGSRLLRFWVKVPNTNSEIGTTRLARARTRGTCDAWLPTARGARVFYLPPYSPDFNPIEQLFAKLKSFKRKAKARTGERLWKLSRRFSKRYLKVNAKLTSQTQATLNLVGKCSSHSTHSLRRQCKANDIPEQLYNRQQHACGSCAWWREQRLTDQRSSALHRPV